MESAWGSPELEPVVNAAIRAVKHVLREPYAKKLVQRGLCIALGYGDGDGVRAVREASMAYQGFCERDERLTNDMKGWEAWLLLGLRERIVSTPPNAAVEVGEWLHAWGPLTSYVYAQARVRDILGAIKARGSSTPDERWRRSAFILQASTWLLEPDTDWTGLEWKDNVEEYSDIEIFARLRKPPATFLAMVEGLSSVRLEA